MLARGMFSNSMFSRMMSISDKSAVGQVSAVFWTH